MSREQGAGSRKGLKFPIDYRLLTYSPFTLLAHHLYYGNDHFLKADPAVLEGVPVIIYIVVVVVGITEKNILAPENIGGVNGG